MIFPVISIILKKGSRRRGRDIEQRKQDSGGILITVEGIEGSGKTTQLAALGAYLQAKGFPVRLTREPGGTPIGDAIRAILLRPDHADMAPMTELLLMGAGRAQHVHEVLRPGLGRGEVLLCDRFSDATLAYQGYGRGLDLERVRWVNEAATGGLKPDLTILLDCPVEMGLERSWARLREDGKAGEESRFEKEALEFHRRVREGYLHIARQEPDRVKVVDGGCPPEGVEEEIREHVCRRLGV